MEEKIPLAGLTSDSSNDEIKEEAFAKLIETRWTSANRKKHGPFEPDGLKFTKNNEKQRNRAPKNALLFV